MSKLTTNILLLKDQHKNYLNNKIISYVNFKTSHLVFCAYLIFAILALNFEK